MLPSEKDWEIIVSDLGISNSDHVVVMIIRMFLVLVEFGTLLYFGHDPKLISVLDGGLKKWINEKRPTSKR